MILFIALIKQRWYFQQQGFKYQDPNLNINITYMPYLYRTEVHQSKICGKGLFAAQDIPKGAVLWVWQQQNPFPILNHGKQIQQNVPLSKEELHSVKDESRLPSIMRESFYYAAADLVIYFRDGAEFMNHSSNPNSQIVYPESNDYRELKRVTLKEIKKGEEICEDYSNYLATQCEWVTELMRKYWPSRVELEEMIVRQREQQRQTNV